MPRLKFELFIQDGSTRGISSRFTDGAGRSTVSYWSSPPRDAANKYSLAIAATCYLKGRYPNIKTERHAQFIRDEFKRQIAEDFIEIGDNCFARLIPGEAVEPTPAPNITNERQARIDRLTLSFVAQQGKDFTAMLFRDNENIGRIGNDRHNFQIALLSPPTLTEMTDIILFAENLNPEFAAHNVSFKIINAVPEGVVYA